MPNLKEDQLFGYEGHDEHWMEQPEDQLDLVRAEEEVIGGNDAGEVVVVGDDDDGDGEIDDGLHYLNWKAK